MNANALDRHISKALLEDCERSRSSGAVRDLVRIQLANTFATRLVGLLGRPRLEVQEGLLLDPGSSIHTMWMRFAIDVVFLDERYRILRIAAQVRPWRFVLAPRHTRFVLELAAGVALASGLERGTLLEMCRKELTVATPSVPL